MRKNKINLMNDFKIDFLLFITLLITISFGMFVLYSASNQNSDIIVNQIFKVLLGFVAMAFTAQLNPQTLKIWTPRLFFFSVFLLILVPIMGEKSLGARRWLDFGIRFQPSEFVKFTLPMMLAWVVSIYGSPKDIKKIILCFVILIIPCGLVLIQPDLGTSILIGSAGIFVIFLAGINWSFILKSLLGFLIFMPLAWNFILKPYQKTRVLTMLDPESDPMGSGYHVIQSKIAIGSGGFSGSGWLEGTQSHLNFIPEQRTDFIFAVLSEEFGFLGFLLLMSLYFLILLRCFYIFFKLKETFDRLVTGALIMIFVCYIFVNIGMVTGILPVVGVPLPLISYGGTSIVSLLSSFGIISAFYHNQKKKTAKNYNRI